MTNENINKHEKQQILQSKQNVESEEDDALLTQVLNEHQEKLDTLSLNNTKEHNFSQASPPTKKVYIFQMKFI
jgi:hypothetical protein